MAYNLIYISEFTSIGGEDYYLSIYKKDYIGNYKNVIASAQPVIHKWQADEPKAPIKGSSLEIRLINENGALPLSNFFSVEDDAFKVMLTHTSALGASTVRFIGYLVQDDCTEEIIDYTHEIVLSATDNLGLLKDVSLNEAAAALGTVTSSVEDISVTAGSNYIAITDFGSSIAAGDTIRVTGTNGVIDGTYYVTSTSMISLDGKRIYTNSTFNLAYSGQATFEIITGIDLAERLPLTTIFRMCLLSTGLELNANVYSKLFEINSASIKFLESTYLDGETFLDGEVWKPCYDVLSIILARFKATLFQSNGEWNIIRQDERRYYNNACPGYRYDKDMVYVSDITLSDQFIIGINEDSFFETGATKSIIRPYKLAKETFNYKQPSNILCNSDLQKLGNLIGTFPDPDNPDYTRHEYEAPCFMDGDSGNLGRGYIRVVRDLLGDEVERYLVTTDSGTFHSVLKSEGIEVNAGDKINISFDFRSDGALITNGSNYLDFRFDVQHGSSPASDYRRLANNGQWQMSPYFRYYWDSGSNTNQWQSVEAESKELVELDGILYIYWPMYAFATQHNETYFRNIRFTITHPISGQTKIIGHTHTDTQTPVIKNKYDEEIFIDDSPRNSINGTMFLPSFTGLLQNRTSRWNVGTTMLDDIKLGNLTTRDELYWRRLPRTKLEGNIYGLYQDNHVSMLTSFRHTHPSMSDLNFIAGMMSIDYVNDSFSGTLWEMFKDSEYTIGTITFDELIDVYEFKYLFEKQ